MFAPSFDDNALTNNIVERLNGTSRAIKSKFEIVARRNRSGRSASLLHRNNQRYALPVDFGIPKLAPSLLPRCADHVFSNTCSCPLYGLFGLQGAAWKQNWASSDRSLGLLIDAGDRRLQAGSISAILGDEGSSSRAIARYSRATASRAAFRRGSFAALSFLAKLFGLAKIIRRVFLFVAHDGSLCRLRVEDCVEMLINKKLAERA